MAKDGMEGTIRIHAVEELGDIYQKYPRQMFAQRQYIELDEAGNVSAGYEGRGGGVPESGLHGCALRWYFPTGVLLSPDGMNALMTDLRGDLQKIHDGREVDRDGRNRVDHQWTSDEASELSIDLDYRISHRDLLSGYQPVVDEKREITD